MKSRTIVLGVRPVLGLLVLAMSHVVASAAEHPLDPLEGTEILQAAQLLLDGGAAQPGTVFQSIELREPPKAEVLAFTAGDTRTRRATVFYRQNKRSYKSEINLTAGSYSSPQLIARSDGQLGLTITEVSDFTFLFSDNRVLQALAARGFESAEELAHIFVTPLTPGVLRLPEEQRRIVKAQLYYTAGAATNLYARPLEGLMVTADLDDRQVVGVRDTGVVPVPTAMHEFDEASVDASYGLRAALKPIRIMQPDGVNFSFDGNFLSWQKWRLHVRFERRAGPVVSLVTYDDRSVLYQGALAEIFVPYQDPDTNWAYRTYMDAGEFGFGLLTSPLKLGLDVPQNAVLRDALVAAAIPDPSVPVVPLPLTGVVGVFERVTGNPLWRHFELFSAGTYEGRAEVELVVRSIAQVGNYDYAIDWIFTERGALRVEVALTGIDAPKAVHTTALSHGGNADTRYGALVAPNLVAPNHSHHFNFRLDLDVDGPQNSFALGELALKETGHANPRKGVWTVEEKTVARESQGALDARASGLWRMFNPQRKNAQGYPRSYLIKSDGNVEPLMKRQDYRRARFIEHNLWLTAYNPNERYAAGDTPNQHPGEPGLPQYIANNQSLVNRDVVAWVTLGFHHVPAAEDWPVLSREHTSLELVPANFFDRNPALDVRRAPFEVPAGP